MFDLDSVLAVHVRGMVAAMKYAGLAMVAEGIRGSIIYTASVAALQGGLGPVASVAAKTANLGLMRAVAGELGEKGVRVNCLSPYGVATPMICETTKKTAGEFEELMCESELLKGAVLRVADIAAAVLFLASVESAFISGQNLIVDKVVTAFNAFFSKVAPN